MTLFQSKAESNRTQQILSVERKNLQTIFDNVSVGMMLIDENGVCRRANRTLSRWLQGDPDLTGDFKAGDVLGCINSLGNPGGCGSSEDCRNCIVSRSIQSVLTTGQAVHDLQAESTIMTHGNPVRFWFEINIDAVFMDGKRCVILLMNNITTRKRAEEELKQLNRTLKALTHSSQALLDTTDEGEYLENVCRIITEDCGHSMVWIGFAEDDQAKSVRPVAFSGFEAGYLETLNISWGDNERGRGPTGTAIRTGKPSSCRNMQTDPNFAPWRAEAARRGYSSSIVLPLMHDGKAFGAMSIYSRETDPFTTEETKLLAELADNLAYGIRALRLQAAHRQAEETLRQTAAELTRSNHDLEQFAYVASHDLMEPLRSVSSFLGLLRKRYHDRLDTDAREYISFAVEGAVRMQTLITDLLSYSRLGSKKVPFRLTDMKVAFDSVMDNLRVSIEEAHASVTCDSLPTVTADLSQMTHLFQNLIGNALKFRSEKPPEILVWSKRENNGWIFAVRDNGIGIEPQYFERIFQIFQRLHSRSKYQGTGIGLALCKRIVERHAGKVWVESAPGEGATFFFTIPDRKAEE